MGDYQDADFASSEPAEGYSVCGRCFDDEHIRAFVESTVDAQECDFCGRKSRLRDIAAPLEGVVDFILQAVNREWDALGVKRTGNGYGTQISQASQ